MGQVNARLIRVGHMLIKGRVGVGNPIQDVQLTFLTVIVVEV